MLDAIPVSTPPAGLAIRAARDLEDVRAHWIVAAACFGMPVQAIEPMIDGAILADGFELFSSERDGIAVASSVLSVSSATGEPVAGIYNVGTLDTHRRPGLGEAMTAHAAALGRGDHGCAVATLQSSPMGYRVYERMGYREVARQPNRHDGPPGAEPVQDRRRPQPLVGPPRTSDGEPIVFLHGATDSRLTRDRVMPEARCALPAGVGHSSRWLSRTATQTATTGSTPSSAMTGGVGLAVDAEVWGPSLDAELDNLRAAIPEPGRRDDRSGSSR